MKSRLWCNKVERRSAEAESDKNLLHHKHGLSILQWVIIIELKPY